MSPTQRNEFVSIKQLLPLDLVSRILSWDFLGCVAASGCYVLVYFVRFARN